MPSKSIESKLHASAARNAELLGILKETDHAVPDLDNQQRLVTDLEAQLRQCADRIGQLDRKREKELKDHEKYRDSVMRRFAYKVSGKREQFEQRAEKEEREYFEALQESHRESEQRRGLEEMLRDAYAAKSSLEASAARHRQAQADLDGLYDSIFQGPTPGFPEEDARETDANEALRAYQEARARADAESQAAQLLSAARRRMRDALDAMRRAVSASHYDMWGGGTMADMMERNALQQADICIRDARMYAVQAARASPAVVVDSLPPVTIAQGSLMSDVFFDNIFTDMAFHEKIRQSQYEAERFAAAVGKLADASGRRQEELAGALREREAALERARVALQGARERVFERTKEIVIP